MADPGGLFFQPDEASVAHGCGQNAFPQGAAVVVTTIEVVIARHKELRTRKGVEEFQPAPKKPQRMADIAGHNQAIGALVGNVLRKLKIAAAIGRAIVEIGSHDNTHGQMIAGATRIRQAQFDQVMYYLLQMRRQR